ncbi:MAG: hypothetical protein Roseis2KO_03500 [Roseivirga sp.]
MIRAVCSNTDNDFLDRLQITVLNELSNPQFDVTRLAHLLSISRAQLTRKSTYLLGQSPGKYILYKRLSLALELLRKGGQPAKNIALMTGFQNYPSFWRAFNKEFKCSPSDYALAGPNFENTRVSWTMPPTPLMVQGLERMLPQHPRITNLFQIVLADIGNEDLSLNYLAARLCIGPSQLLRDLKTHLQVTPMRLLLYLRLLYAAELLSDTCRPIGEIAHKAGFFDQAHLSRAFKLIFHTSPSAYRQQNYKQEFLSWLRNHLMQQDAMS